MRAETIARALGGYRSGRDWMARCPAHDDQEPGLAIRDIGDKVLVRCHAGCAQEDVIDALRAKGLWNGRHKAYPRASCEAVRPARCREEHDSARSAAALTIWRAAIPIDQTPVVTYLASCGLRPPANGPALRFCAGLRHPSGGRWPCMVALVTSGFDAQPLAIHRTFLNWDGAAKAPVNPAKMMLGPCSGGAVRFAEPEELLMVGEGIETCLAAMQATDRPAWAALSTSGLRSLDLPPQVREVIVLADGDTAGEAAARECAARWTREHRLVRIARPPRGMDFNDLLLGRRGPRWRHGMTRHLEKNGLDAVRTAVAGAEAVRDPLVDLTERTAKDPGAPFAPDVIARLASLKTEDRAAFERLHARLRSAGCRVIELDKAIAALGADTVHSPNQADILLEIAEAAELFHSPDDEALADLPIDGHRETWSVRGKSLKTWLTHGYYQETGSAPKSDPMQSALNIIEARARFDAPERRVFVRIGRLDG